MNTLLESWDGRYTDRVRLLVDILPVLAQEPRFALKGGTAINLFEHDLPRLSVDIDLAWLPVHGYAEDAKLIAEALMRLADVLRARPLQLQVQTSAGEGTAAVTRLVASRGRSRVQIETTPVMRGTVHPVRSMVVRPRVEEAFGFQTTQHALSQRLGNSPRCSISSPLAIVVDDRREDLAHSRLKMSAALHDRYGFFDPD